MAAPSEQKAYEFAQRVMNELESRLREAGVNEDNLYKQHLERTITEDGVWMFVLNGETILTADPNAMSIR